MISYYKAEQKVLNKMSLNPSIPDEMFETLVHDEFLGTAVCKPKTEIVYPRVSSKVESIDLGTEPEDLDLIQG